MTTIDPSLRNQVMYALADSLGKADGYLGYGKVDELAKEIFDAKNVPEDHRAEILSKFKWNLLGSAHNNYYYPEKVLKELVPDPASAQKLLHASLSSTIDRASFHQDLDAFLGAAVSLSSATPDEVRQLALRLPDLERWAEGTHVDIYAKKKTSEFDAKDARLVTEAFSNTMRAVLTAVKAQTSLEPSIIQAYEAFRHGVTRNLLTQDELQALAVGELGRRLAAIEQGQVTATSQAPLFLLAETQGIVAPSSELSQAMHARLDAEYKAMSNPKAAWAALDPAHRDAAQALRGPPPGADAVPVRSIDTLHRVLAHAGGTATMGQMRPAVAAFAAELKGKDVMKAHVAGATRGERVLDLAAGLTAAKALAIALPKGADKLLDQAIGRLTKAIAAGEVEGMALTGAAQAAQSLVSDYGLDAAQVYAPITRAICEALAKQKLPTHEVAQLVASSDPRLAAFSRTLAESLVADAIHSEREAQWYYLEKAPFGEAHPRVIPDALAKPIIDALKESSAQSPGGLQTVNGILSMHKAYWISQEMVTSYLAAQPAAAQGLAALTAIRTDDARAIATGGPDLAGFDRVGDTYYLARAGADSKMELYTKDASGAEKVIAGGEFSVKAIRVIDDAITVLSDLNGAGYFAVYDRSSGERLRRRALPVPINHAANPSAAVTKEGNVVFPEHKHGKADTIVSVSPDFTKDVVNYVAQGGPKGFKANAVCIDGEHAYAAFTHDGKRQLQIQRYTLPDMSASTSMITDFVRAAGYGDAEAIWSMGGRLFLADRDVVRVFALGGDEAKPIATLPYEGVRGAKPRDDGGVDLVLSTGAAARLVSLTQVEADQIFVAPLAQ